MKEALPFCIICHNEDVNLHFYPPNKFNNKDFYYYKCNHCHSLSIFPIPALDDFNLIYGTNDHSYLLNYPEGQTVEHNFEYKQHTYQKYQLDFLEKAIPLSQGKTLLDYACGNGYYMAYAKTLGFQAVGIEFSDDFAKLLRSKTEQNIYSIKEFEQKYSNKKFDIIHFGHVLEHFVDPYKGVNDIRRFSHKDTLYIFDGPLENNTCLSRLILNMGSKWRKRKYNEYQPQHLSFTTYYSQLLFFNKLNLKTIKYIAVEQYWPLPDRVKSIPSFFKYCLARCSILLSSIFKKQGNVFHFVGKIT